MYYARLAWWIFLSVSRSHNFLHINITWHKIIKTEYLFKRTLSTKWLKSNFFRIMEYVILNIYLITIRWPFLMKSRIKIHKKDCPVGWGCRIHRLLLFRGVRPPNECPGYDTKQSFSKTGALGKAEYPFIAIAPRSTQARSGSTW